MIQRPTLVAAAMSLALLGAPAAQAQSSGSGLAAYTFEVTPLVGLNLPDDIWGVGILKTIGLQAAWSFMPSHALVGGYIFQSGPNDTGHTTEVLYRYESSFKDLGAYFVVGLHSTKFDLGIDYDETGACDPANCLTDSGWHYGIDIGGGLTVPLSPMVPFKIGMRFLKKQPKLMLLLDAGVGIRF